MEFARTAEGASAEVFESTAPVPISGKNLEAALRSFKDRKVIAAGFDEDRLWVRVAKGKGAK